MRTPRMYFHSRFSTSARVSALIIPRSATMQTDPIPNRLFNRSTMGTRLFTSAVLPGHSSVQSGLPLVQHHAHYHLLQVGTMIFGMPALADSLASFALEVDRRGIEKHDVQIGEQITAPRKQRLLNEVLVGAGSERRSAVLLVFRKHLS